MSSSLSPFDSSFLFPWEVVRWTSSLLLHCLLSQKRRFVTYVFSTVFPLVLSSFSLLSASVSSGPTMAKTSEDVHKQTLEESANFRIAKRLEATERERRRMRLINEAFTVLQGVLPCYSQRNRLPKYDCLRLAIQYIEDLQAVLRQSESQERSLLGEDVSISSALAALVDYEQGFANTASTCSSFDSWTPTPTSFRTCVHCPAYGVQRGTYERERCFSAVSFAFGARYSKHVW